MRHTSIEAYAEIMSNGMLNGMRLFVYEILWAAIHGGGRGEGVVDDMTAQEMRRWATAWYGTETTEHLPKRLSELEEWGVIRVNRTKICEVTGRKAIAWSITGNLPVKPRRQTTADKKNEAIALLRIMYNKTSITDEEWISVTNIIKSI